MQQSLYQRARSRDNFKRLTRAEQVEAIRLMAAGGATDYTIASATRLSVEFIRQSLSLVDVESLET